MKYRRLRSSTHITFTQIVPFATLEATPQILLPQRIHLSMLIVLSALVLDNCFAQTFDVTFQFTTTCLLSNVQKEIVRARYFQFQTMNSWIIDGIELAIIQYMIPQLVIRVAICACSAPDI